MTEAEELGPLRLLEHLEDTLSNVILISERTHLAPGVDPRTELDRLYESIVGS